MPLYQGSCHCGAIKFEIEALLTDFTRCDCSICTKKNAVMTRVHEDDFKLLQGAENLGRYQWNSHRAVHHFCKICGIYTFHRKTLMPDHYGINVFCLEGADLADIPIRLQDGKSMPLEDESKNPK